MGKDRRMYAGTQYFGTSKTEMEFLVRHRVTHFDATVPDMEVDTPVRHREDQAPAGVTSRVNQTWAFQFGYIIAFIQALEHEYPRPA